MSKAPIKRSWELLPRLSKLKQAAYTYQWKQEDDVILPDHYKKKCLEFMKREPTPVHWTPEPGRWKYDKHFKRVLPIQNVPIRVMYPEEANRGLWGGEGIVKGFKKKDTRFAKRIPNYWFPYLTKRAIYSEILDKWLSITVTMRTLDLIDEAYGLDNYILKTHERDLNSKLAMDLRREMLLALARKTIYPDNPEKREKILKKYAEFIIPGERKNNQPPLCTGTDKSHPRVKDLQHPRLGKPLRRLQTFNTREEEAEWVGLSVGEALIKAKEIQDAQNQPIPLKDLLTEELINKIERQKITGEDFSEPKSSVLTKLNPFSRKEK